MLFFHSCQDWHFTISHNNLFIPAILSVTIAHWFLFCSIRYFTYLQFILKKFFSMKILHKKCLHGILCTLIRSIHISNTRDCSSVKIYYCRFTSLSHLRAQNSLKWILLLHKEVLQFFPHLCKGYLHHRSAHPMSSIWIGASVRVRKAQKKCLFRGLPIKHLFQDQGQCLFQKLSHGDISNQSQDKKQN